MNDVYKTDKKLFILQQVKKTFVVIYRWQVKPVVKTRGPQLQQLNSYDVTKRIILSKDLY
jgi:hypothetical protein